MDNKEYYLLKAATGLDIKVGQAFVLVVHNGQPAQVYCLPYYNHLLVPSEISEEKPSDIT